MAEENKNHFILNKSFPKIISILKKKKSIEEMLRDAIFVLDTNSLLAPYQTGKDDIEKIKNTYTKLISENRLFIPEHVLREFAKNRSVKIGELYSQIDIYISQIPSVKSFEYPILGELESYLALNKAREEVTVAIKKYGECLKELKNGIVNWNWSDPVSVMYSTTFTENIIFACSSSEDDLLKEYYSRLEYNIPPGNKDKTKESNAIGDFLIWKSILELGITQKRDIVFISNDEKNDWLLKGNKKSISTRYELVHEFFDKTNGNNFLCMTFASFMEAQGVEINLVQNLSFEEILEMPISEEERTGTLESLRQAYDGISTFINNLKTEKETNYIEGNISEPIKHFKAAFHNEFSNTTEWKFYSDFFYKFSDWLSKIDSYNYEIHYQEIRMKRNTDTQRLLMIALAKEFISQYELFSIL